MSVRADVLLLAAGQSSRMRGEDKLLKEIGGRPLLLASAQACLDSLASRTLVAVSPGATGRMRLLEDLPVEIVEVPDADKGISASIRAGVSRVSRDSAAVLIALADMPDIGAADMDRVLRGFRDQDTIVRASTASGLPGHPALFPRKYFGALLGLEGDKGASGLLAKLADKVRLVTVSGNRARTDLDTPEDWEGYLRPASGSSVQRP